MELQPRRGKHRELTGEEWEREFWRLFEVTADMGYRVWGVATDGALRSVYPYRPFLFRSYLTASCMGVRAESGIRFDESFQVKEDCEIGLRCILEDGGFLAARYLFWSNHHWHDEGGCHEYRTQRMERETIARLKRKYPGMLRQVTRGGSEFSIEITA